MFRIYITSTHQAQKLTANILPTQKRLKVYECWACATGRYSCSDSRSGDKIQMPQWKYTQNPRADHKITPQPRGVYFRNLTLYPLLFAGLSLPRIKMRPKHSAVKGVFWAEHKIEAVFELSNLENPCMDSMFGLIYEFESFNFLFFGVICLVCWQLTTSRQSWQWDKWYLIGPVR